MWAFLLTRPMRDVTIKAWPTIGHIVVSTHTPHAGRDTEDWEIQMKMEVSTHTPHAGRDNSGISRLCQCDCVSTHTPDAGRDMKSEEMSTSWCCFYSHAPCGT